jgi:hypothetical protein
MDEQQWQDDKQAKRDAADKFLLATINDPELRKNVLANPSYAREALQKLGGITIPPSVEVICVDTPTEARNRLVVFVLPNDKAPAPAEPWRDSWVAAWSPY